MNLPLEKAAQLATIVGNYEKGRKQARALGLERSFCELVYKDITGFGSIKDTYEKSPAPSPNRS